MVSRYTNFILTIIAIALLILVGQNALSVGRAAIPGISEVQKVQICDDISHCASLTPHLLEVGSARITTYALTVAQQ
jgi:hypothetical protein